MHRSLVVLVLRIGAEDRTTAWTDQTVASFNYARISTHLDRYRTFLSLHPRFNPFLIYQNDPHSWGSPEFIGLGFLSFISIVLTELFGSPFLKNVSIIVGLAVGCIVSGAAGYIDGSSIKTAPAITFLWVKTFKIRVYPPAILPMLAVYSQLPICFSSYRNN